MSSVGDKLRAEATREVGGLTPAARIALAFRLGDEDLESYRRHRNLTRQIALQHLRRQRRRGRRPSHAAGTP
jgi:hypothetical protein